MFLTKSHDPVQETHCRLQAINRLRAKGSPVAARRAARENENGSEDTRWRRPSNTVISKDPDNEESLYIREMQTL